MRRTRLALALACAACSTPFGSGGSVVVTSTAPSCSSPCSVPRPNASSMRRAASGSTSAAARRPISHDQPARQRGTGGTTTSFTGASP
jgi:hypothetical protein